MPSMRPSRAPSPSTAILVRVAAFAIVAASVVLIPASFAAAASGHAATATAFVATGAASGLSVVASLAARGFDPLRG